MAALKKRVRKSVVSIQVINMACQCGGGCVNEQGSYMIEIGDVIATCENCGERYQVPSSVFNRQVSK